MEVSFIDIIKVVLKRWWIIVLTIVIGGTSAFLITNTEKPKYVSEASLYAEVNKSKEGEYTFQDLNFVHALIPTFYDIMNEDMVYDELSDMLAEEGIYLSREELKSKFTFVSNSDSQSQSLIFRIRCTDSLKSVNDEGEDLYFSEVLLDAFLNIAIQKVPNIITSVEVKIAAIPHYVSTIKPNTLFNSILGAFIGLVAGLLIVFVINSLDTRINSTQDISQKIGVPVVGVIPTEVVVAKEENENV